MGCYDNTDSPMSLFPQPSSRRYGYEDDVYGSCSCGETRPHRHDGDGSGSKEPGDG